MTKTKAEPEESVMGFKDKQKALDTLKALDGRDISYQYNVITGFVRRAKRVLEITKDEEKLSKIRDAVKVFNEWLDDYKENNRSKENFSYLPLETAVAYKVLAKSYGVLEDDFLKAYEEENGDYKTLREVKVPDTEVTWDIERNRKLKEIVSKIKSSYIPWYKVDDGPYRGLPSEEHVKCILLGYSPEPTKIKKLIAQVIEKSQNSSEPNAMSDESDSSKKSRKRRHSKTSSTDVSEKEAQIASTKNLKQKSPKTSKINSE